MRRNLAMPNSKRNHELFNAIRDGDVSAVRKILYSEGTLLHSTQEDISPLYCARYESPAESKYELLNALVEYGANIDEPGKDGLSLIQEVLLQTTKKEITKFLDTVVHSKIQEYSEEVEDDNPELYKHSEEEIEKKAAELKKELCSKEVNGKTLYAIFDQRKKRAKLLCDAIEEGEYNYVNNIISQDPYAVNFGHDGFFPLSYAVTSAETGILKLLLENGADLNQSSNIMEVLMFFCPNIKFGEEVINSEYLLIQNRETAFNIARALLKKYAEENTATNILAGLLNMPFNMDILHNPERTPAMLAQDFYMQTQLSIANADDYGFNDETVAALSEFERNLRKSLLLLIENLLDLSDFRLEFLKHCINYDLDLYEHVVKKTGISDIKTAVALYGEMRLREMVLQQAKSIELPQLEGDLAVLRGIIRLLIIEGANLDVLDPFYLHQVIQDGELDLACLLVEHGVNPNVKGPDKKTALDYLDELNTSGEESEQLKKLIKNYKVPSEITTSPSKKVDNRKIEFAPTELEKLLRLEEEITKEKEATKTTAEQDELEAILKFEEEMNRAEEANAPFEQNDLDEILKFEEEITKEKEAAKTTAEQDELEDILKFEEKTEKAEEAHIAELIDYVEAQKEDKEILDSVVNNFIDKIPEPEVRDDVSVDSLEIIDLSSSGDEKEDDTLPLIVKPTPDTKKKSHKLGKTLAILGITVSVLLAIAGCALPFVFPAFTLFMFSAAEIAYGSLIFGSFGLGTSLGFFNKYSQDSSKAGTFKIVMSLSPYRHSKLSQVPSDEEQGTLSVAKTHKSLFSGIKCPKLHMPKIISRCFGNSTPKATRSH